MKKKYVFRISRNVRSAESSFTAGSVLLRACPRASDAPVCLRLGRYEPRRPRAVDPVEHGEAVWEVGMSFEIPSGSVDESRWPLRWPEAYREHIELARLVIAALRVALRRTRLLHLDSPVTVGVLVFLAVLALDSQDTPPYAEPSFYIWGSVAVERDNARDGLVAFEGLEQVVLGDSASDSDREPLPVGDDLEQLEAREVKCLLKGVSCSHLLRSAYDRLRRTEPQHRIESQRGCLALEPDVPFELARL